MKAIKIFTIYFILLLVCSCQRKEPSDVVLIFLDEVEVYSEVYLSNLITFSNVQLAQDFKLALDRVGQNEYIVNYIYNNKEYQRDIVVDVVDKVSPFIFSGGNRTIILGSKPDFCNSLIYGDNYDKEPICEVVGEYDTSNIGTYYPKLKITDSSGNTTEKDLTIEVVSKIESSNENKEEIIEFAKVKEKYQKEGISLGIDVSSWQETVDYNEVKKAGAEFVIIRLGFQSSSTRELKIDSFYEENIKNARDAGLKVGVYLYTTASSANEARMQAEWVLNILNKQHLDLPIVFDWEDFSYFRKSNFSLYEFNKMADIFIKTVHDAGYQGMLYSSKIYLENFWENKNDYPVWLAHYTDETSYQGNYLIWQMGNTGQIAGINGNVDINIMYEGGKNG
ncbi:MAG: GH25 family lysozyme [Bacilli bacterium]|nr:GH25 family lysozyme [Bacilli bacterium]